METYSVYVDGDPHTTYKGTVTVIGYEIDGVMITEINPAYQFAVRLARDLWELGDLYTPITVVRDSDGAVVWKDGRAI